MKKISLRKRYIPFPKNNKLVPKLCTIFIIRSFLIANCLVASIYLILSFTVNFSNSEEYISKEKEGKETTISHNLFGIGGSAKAWNNRSRYSELWWRPNITRGFMWLDEKPHENEPWSETLPPYKVSQDTSKFKYSCGFGDRSAVRIARIVNESFELGLKNVRWFVLGDDDTVFFPENLVTVLAKYDHNQMYYIGGNSESVETNVVFSYSMAYGGGGIAISYPLAADLVKILDSCINRYHYLFSSDQKIGSCVAEIGVSLTKETGFHQALRRQCCEVINEEDGIRSSLHIRIRGCNKWETVTPPFYDKYGDFAYFQRMVR